MVIVMTISLLSKRYRKETQRTLFDVALAYHPN